MTGGAEITGSEDKGEFLTVGSASSESEQEEGNDLQLERKENVWN